MRWSPRTRPSGSRVWKRREGHRPRAGRCHAPARARPAIRARLDAELLMAEALHIDRDRLILSPPDRPVPKRFWDMVERRKRRASRSPTSPAAAPSGTSTFTSAPACSCRARIREVLIASAIEHFEGTEGPKRILDLGTGPGTLLLAALDIWPNATGLGIDVSRQALSYASANARRLGFETRLKLMQGNWADGHGRELRPHPVQSALRRGRGRARAGRRANMSRTKRCSPASEGLDAYRALAPQLPRLAATGRPCGGRDRPRSGRRGHGPARARRACKRRVAQDFAGRDRALLLVNLGLSENRLAFGVGRTTSGLRAGPAPDQLTSAPVPTPDAIGRSLRAWRRPEREGQEPALPVRGPARLRRKGLATLRKDVGI